MAETIIITPVPQEQAIIPEREPFLLADAQTKTVDLNMASGNQVVSPDAGKLLSQVTVQKPASLAPSNIKKNVTIGGVEGNYEGPELPTLDNPAGLNDVLAGKQILVRTSDHSAVKGTGQYEVPTQTKSVDLDMSGGSQQITPATGFYLSGVQINKPATMISGNIKKDVNIGGVVGTLDPDAFEYPLLNVYHTFVTVGTNSANTVQKAKDYLYGLAGITETNRMFALALRATTGFVTNEVGRIVQYPNSNNWTIALYNPTTTPSHWTTGSMSSTAVLQVGRTYDVYWWRVPADVPQ